MGNIITRGFQASLFAMAAISLVFVTGSSSRAYAQTNEDQCVAGFYHYSDGLLKSIDPLGDSVMEIGANVASQLQSALPSENQDLVINASGFNDVDGLIYSIVTDPISIGDPGHNGLSGGQSNELRPNYVHLAVTDPQTGVVTDLGEPTLATNSGYNLAAALTNTQRYDNYAVEAGTMHGGFLYVAIGGSNEIDNDVYKIDVTTNTYEVISISYGTENAPGTVQLGGDFVYIDGVLYGIEGAHTSGGYDPARFVRIDLASGTGEAVDMLTLPEQDRTFGSMWATNDGGVYRIFTHDDASGLMYEITNFESGTPTATQVSSATTVTDGDGISCSESEMPDFSVDAQDDATSTFVDSSVDIDLFENDTAYFDFSVVSVDADSAEGGTIVDNGGGSVTFTPATGYDGDDTFSYQVCLDGFNPEICDVAEVTVTVEEEPVEESTDDGGAVLGATTDGSSSDDEGSVLGEGDVLAETGVPGFVSVAMGFMVIATLFVTLWLTPRSYVAVKQDI